MEDIARKSLQQKSQQQSFWSSASRPTTKSISTITQPVEVDVTVEHSIEILQPSTSQAADENQHCEQATEANPGASEAPKQRSLMLDISQLQEKLLA